MKKTTSLMLAFILITLIVFCSCSKHNNVQQTTETVPVTYIYETITAETEAVTETPYSEIVTEIPTVPVTEAPTTELITTEIPLTEAPTAAPETAPVIETTEPVPEETQPASIDYTSYTKEQIVSTLAEAVNKTKAYTGNITVNHKESFDATVKDVQPGGALVARAVDFVKGLVLKPSEEVYSFSNGTAVTSEGENTQLLLPKAAPFTLGADGVADASISEENGLVHINIELNEERCTDINSAPAYNSSSIGYLNLGDIVSNFNIIKVSKIDVNYPGSVIDCYIRPDGYVSSVTYTINMDTYAEASGMNIQGSAEFSGAQTEIWNINW